MYVVIIYISKIITKKYEHNLREISKQEEAGEGCLWWCAACRRPRWEVTSYKNDI